MEEKVFLPPTVQRFYMIIFMIIVSGCTYKLVCGLTCGAMAGIVLSFTKKHHRMFFYALMSALIAGASAQMQRHSLRVALVVGAFSFVTFYIMLRTGKRYQNRIPHERYADTLNDGEIVIQGDDPDPEGSLRAWW